MNPDRFPKVMKLLVICAMLLVFALSVLAGPVFAGATWGSVTGPEWLNPGYRFTVTGVGLTSPHGNVCMRYTVDPPSTDGAPFPCSNQGGGTWVCESNQNYFNATVTWQLSAHPSTTGCPSNNVELGPQGSFQTGPTAVTLQSFSSRQQPPVLLLSATGVLAMLFISAAALKRRRTA